MIAEKSPLQCRTSFRCIIYTVSSRGPAMKRLSAGPRFRCSLSNVELRRCFVVSLIQPDSALANWHNCLKYLACIFNLANGNSELQSAASPDQNVPSLRRIRRPGVLPPSSEHRAVVCTRSNWRSAIGANRQQIGLNWFFRRCPRHATCNRFALMASGRITPLHAAPSGAVEFRVMCPHAVIFGCQNVLTVTGSFICGIPPGIEQSTYVTNCYNRKHGIGICILHPYSLHSKCWSLMPFSAVLFSFFK